jgi:sec-independent protein translocase protein TatA
MTSMTSLGLIGPIGWPELLVIGLVMLLLFGRRLPEVARSLGDGIREFKKGVKDTAPDWNEDRPNPYAAARPPLSPSGDDRRVGQTPGGEADAGPEGDPVPAAQSSKD